MNPLITIRPELLALSADQIKALMPYFSIFGGTVLAILGSVMKVIHPKWPVYYLSLITCFVGAFFSFELLKSPTLNLFNEMMVSDAYSHFFNLIFLGSAIFTILSSFRYLDREELQYPEYYVLILFSALGMMLMASAQDLIVIFIALELMSLCIYILVGFRRTDRRSNEAAVKYFILGGVASAILLYGVAIVYGITGSTQLKNISQFLSAHPESFQPIFMLGSGMIMIGFLFKIASVPFHMWMPDVYEGAPTPVTGFMTTGLKAAAFATFIRVFLMFGYGQNVAKDSLAFDFNRHIHDIFWISAVLTMIIGNVIALMQTHLKRMLAYSSIAHTGYLLIGMLVGSQNQLGFAPVVFYLFVYAVMNLGAFIILSVLSEREDAGLNLYHLSGLSQRHPWLAFSMAVFLFSMAGIPPAAGFISKYFLFYAAVQAKEIPLVIIAVLCSAISVYYYLRVLVYMYMKDPVGSPPVVRVPLGTILTITFLLFLTLFIGVMPTEWIEFVKKAILE